MSKYKFSSPLRHNDPDNPPHQIQYGENHDSSVHDGTETSKTSIIESGINYRKDIVDKPIITEVGTAADDAIVVSKEKEVLETKKQEKIAKGIIPTDKELEEDKKLKAKEEEKNFKENVLSFEEFNNLLLGPDGKASEVQESFFGVKATTAVTGEAGLFWDLEGHMEENLTAIHGGKVINGHTFTFSSGRYLNLGDYLQIQKIDENGVQVDEIEIPLGKTGNLTAEKQYEEYAEFVYGKKYNEEWGREDIVNAYVEIAEKYMGQSDFFLDLSNDKESYQSFIQRITPTKYYHKNHGLQNTDGSTFYEEGTKIGNIVKYTSYNDYPGSFNYGGTVKYKFTDGTGQDMSQAEIREAYEMLRLAHQRSDVADRIFTNIIGGGLRTIARTDEEVETAILGENIILSENEQIALTSEQDKALRLKIRGGVDGDILTTSDNVILTGGEMVTATESVKYINSKNAQAIANVTAKMQGYADKELAKWSANYEEELENIIAESEVEIQSIINTEFGDDIDLINADYKLLEVKWGNQEQGIPMSEEAQGIFQSIFDQIYNEINEQIENGTFEGIIHLGHTIEDEANKRANEKVNAIYQSELVAIAEKHKPKLDEIEARQKDLIDIKNKDLNLKYQEAWKLYWEGDKEKGIVGVSERYYDKIGELSDHYDNVIDDGVFQKLGDMLYDMEFHRAGTSYKTKKYMIAKVWNDYKLTLPDDLSESEIENHRQEFYHRIGKQINFGNKGLSTNAIISNAEEVIKNLGAKEDLTGDEKDLLRIAEDIIDKPENFSKWGVVNFWEGLTSQRAEYWIPIAGSIIDGYRQSEIRDIISMRDEGKELSSTQESILMMYQGKMQIDQSLQNKSTGYTVGAGTIDTLKFMAEMILTRGIGRAVGTTSKVVIGVNRVQKSLQVTNNTLKGYTKAQRAAAGYSQFKYGSMVVSEKAIKVWETMWSSLGQTVTGGSGRIYSDYQMRMTPEMAFSISNVGEELVVDIKNLGYYDAKTKTFKEDADPINTFFKSLGSTYTDFITERCGEALPLIGKMFKDNPGLFGQVVLGKYLKKIGFNPATQDVFATIKKAGGYNGMIPEVFEEILAQPIHNWIDGNDLNEGMDWETFYKPVIVQTAIFQVAFMGGGKMYKKAKGIKDPSYQADGIAFSSEENMTTYIRQTLKENGGVLPEGFEITINNDAGAFGSIENILKSTGNSNIEVKSTNLEIEVNDQATALEIEATNDLGTEKVKEVEEMNTEVEKLKEEQKEVEKELGGTDQSGEQRQTILDKITAIKIKINSINAKKRKILQPTIEKINKNKTTPKYQKGLDNIKKFLEKIDPFTSVLEMDNSQDTKAFFKENEMEIRYKEKGIQRVVNAETGKITYIDIQTNQTLGKTDLIERGIVKEGMEFDQRGKGVDLIQMEVDQLAKSEDFSLVHGFHGENVDGKSFIVINKDAAIKLGASNVSLHELLHRFLKKTFKDHPHTQLAIGNALEGYLMDLNPKQIQNSDLRKSLIGYQQQQGAFVSAEETLTLFSDAIAKGEITFNETVFTKVGDMIRRAFSAVGMRVEFNTARDVMNFIRDYNKAMESGKVSAGMKATFKKGAKITGRMKQGSDGYAKSMRELGYEQNKDGSFKSARDDSGLIQFSRVYQEVEEMKSDLMSTDPKVKADAAMMAAYTLRNEIDRRLPELKNITPADREDIVNNFMLDDKRGLVGTLLKYDETRNESIMGYLNAFVPGTKMSLFDARLIEFYKDDPRFGNIIQSMEQEGVLAKMEKELGKQFTTPKLTKEQKARELISLSNVYGIATSIDLKNKIESIIRKNPKDLDVKLRKLVEGEIRKAIVTQMGDISFTKGKVKVSEEFKAFMALNYENIVRGLDVTTIKNNYKTLFELTEIGKEDRKTKKTDKPTLKKDSNYRKGVFKIETNKAIFTKFFTDETSLGKDGKPLAPQSHYNKIKDRQKKLAILIAEGTTSDIINDEIIENSEDTDAIVSAKLRDFGNSLNKQKNEVRGNYNDQLKFSKEILADAVFLQAQVKGVGIDGVFKDGKLLPKYKNVNPKAASFIYNDLYKEGLIDDVSDIKFIQQAFKDLIKAGDRGTQYEQHLINQAIALEKKFGTDVVEVVLRKPTEKGGKPDLIVKIYGTEFNIEAKMSNAQYSSVTFADPNNGFTIKKNYTFNEDILKLGDEVQPGIEIAKARLKLEGFNWTNLTEIPTEYYNILKNEFITVDGVEMSYITAMSAEMDISLDVVSEIYNKKKGYPVNYIQMMGRGLFYMGGFNDATNVFGVPKLEGDATITLRISSNTKTSVATEADVAAGKTPNNSVYKNGESGAKWQIKRDVKSIAWRAIPLIPKSTLDNLKSNHSIGNVASLENLINSRGAQNLKMSKEVKGEIQKSKAINNSRVININTPSIGMSAWDFDDTLATTKSGVRATIPNEDGTPQPGRKVIFLAGGAGSGKSNVVSKLGLEDQGFKVVNSDISLEWLKKNSGLPANMNDLTKEQLSELGKLQYQSRQISKGKMMKYQGNAEGVVVDGTGGSINAMTGLVNEFKAKGYDVSMVFVETSLETALERNKAREERSLTDKIVTKNHEAVQGNKDGFKEMFGERFMEVKTDNLTQEDAMPADLTTKMNDFVSGYKKVRLDAEQFATEGADILAQGGEFDFSEFNVVTGGEVGPMFNTAMNRAKKFGTKDTYVLTARPPAAAVPIQQFLASQGLNIPLENITGLGNSTGEAKAEWMLGKFSEGYNNMFFADDAMQNVKAVKDVLDQLDIKSKVVQAKIQFSKKMKSTMDEVLDGTQLTNIKKQSSINDVKSIDRLTNEGVYSNIKFSKKHRGEYENLISKHRPDLVKEGLVSGTVDNMFNYIDNLDVPADKKRKYERITTKWIATSNIKLNEDSYKIKDAVELSEKYKEDIFSYNNPNEIIEKYAGKPKGPIDPNTVEQFRENKSFENKKYGITEYNVLDGTTSEGSYVTEEVKEAQETVRKVIDTHWGENSNPWCITQKKNGKLTEDSFDNWIEYSDGPKRIVFQNGKLLAFYANDLYWDRMDNDTDAPVVYIKEGRVTKKVELVPVGKNKVDEFVMEVRTVSEDGNTVTTEVVGETDSSYEVGTKIVENRVNGITVKKTRSTADKTSIEWGFEPGSVQEVQNYNKKGELTSSVFYQEADVIGTINYAEQFGGITESEIVEGKGDIISHEGGGEFFAQINLAKQGIKNADSAVTTEIGWEMDGKLEDVITTSSNGEIRVDLKKILKIDPELQGLPRNIQFSKKIDVDLNQILEESMNVDAKKRFSATQAKLKGGKFKVRGVIPPSAQDFMGLLYNFVGKGKQGDQHLEMLKKALVDPFARGIDQLNTARQNSSEDYRALLKQFPDVKRDLNLKLGKLDGLPDHISDFTIDQAVRVYLWNKSGFDVPGLSARDLKALDSFVKDDSELLAFADGLGIISKKTEGYTKPGEYWLVENIASDLMSDGAIGDARSEFLAEWLENKNIIFSEENLNKIEVIYGSKFREALKDVLYRMETGKNRPQGSGRILNMYMNWVNNSVGAIMFFNIRSAVLQTISATNYINWSDNNPLKAAAAFANQKQFWSDFVMLFNSDYLKQRRSGNRRGVNEAELSAAVAGSENKVKAALAWLLKKGFTPTQIADSFAIASGGAAFYRNRVKSLMKEGMSKAEAETQAFLDFQETTEVSQQSARPDMISQQQANPLGRIILAFQNTPMQYGRIMNKAFRDLANGRGDAKTHVSKIVYYGAVQSIIFTALQSALFAVLGSDDDDEKEEMIDKKTTRMLNSMIDTWLTSIGYGGKAISTVKNTIMEYNKQRAKDVDEDFMTKSDHAYTLLQALSFSPPIGSKLRKIYQSIQTEKFNRDIMKERGLTLDNPVWGMIGNVIEGVTNIPLGRISNKMLNLDNALDSRNETWQRIAMLMGWNTWDLGIKDPDLVALGEDIKERKKQEKKMETEKKKFEKKREKLKEKYPGKTDEEIEIAVKSKELFDLSKQDQIDLLKKLEVSDKEIKKLKKEQDRTDKIAELYKENSKLIDDFVKESKNKPKKKKEKKKEVKLSKSEKREKDLFKMNKKDQVNLLLELGYSPRKVNSLKYEKDRVRVIMKLEGKKSK